MSLLEQVKPFTATPTATNVLLYGDPKTGKTSRALGQSPGPRLVIDGEGGTDARMFAAIAGPDDRRFVADDASQLIALVEELVTTSHPYRTVIIDPITVYWESLQWMEMEREARKQRCDVAGVKLSVAFWGRVKMLWRRIVDRLVRAPFHVVFIARGSEAIDGRGNSTGYKYRAEKTLDALVHTIVCFRNVDGNRRDFVEGDRTQTFPTGPSDGPLDLSPLFSSTGGVDAPNEDHGPSVTDLKRAILTRASELGMAKTDAGPWFHRLYPSPETMTAGERREALEHIAQANPADEAPNE